MNALSDLEERRRLLDAVAHLAGTKGVVGLNPTDVAARADVPEGSFYEHFEGLDDCYVQAFSQNAEILVRRVAAVLEAEGDPAEQLRAGMRAYVGRLSLYPHHARAFLLESLRAGPEALDRRSQIHMEFVELFRSAYDRARDEHPELDEVSENSVIGLIGGINELVCRELERGGQNADVSRVEPDVIRLTESVFGLL